MWSEFQAFFICHETDGRREAAIFMPIVQGVESIFILVSWSSLPQRRSSRSSSRSASRAPEADPRGPRAAEAASVAGSEAETVTSADTAEGKGTSGAAAAAAWDVAPLVVAAAEAVIAAVGVAAMTATKRWRTFGRHAQAKPFFSHSSCVCFFLYFCTVRFWPDDSTAVVNIRSWWNWEARFCSIPSVKRFSIRVFFFVSSEANVKRSLPCFQNDLWTSTTFSLSPSSVGRKSLFRWFVCLYVHLVERRNLLFTSLGHVCVRTSFCSSSKRLGIWRRDTRGNVWVFARFAMAAATFFFSRWCQCVMEEEGSIVWLFLRICLFFFFLYDFFASGVAGQWTPNKDLSDTFDLLSLTLFRGDSCEVQFPSFRCVRPENVFYRKVKRMERWEKV
jgi:hypothetical protein